MNKQKIKRIIKFQKYLILFLVLIIWIWAWTVFANSFVKLQINEHINNNIRWIDIKSNSWAYYVNYRNNSSIINNYFKGYYYDQLYWVFKLDWSSNKNENVRIINWSYRCATWYWYNLWWKAKWLHWWFIDFSWVYYCLSDKKLHWKWYSKYFGVQEFDWISFEIITEAEDISVINNKDFFINDSTRIMDRNIIDWNNSETSNASDFTLWWEKFFIDDTKESIFYIIK